MLTRQTETQTETETEVERQGKYENTRAYTGMSMFHIVRNETLLDLLTEAEQTPALARVQVELLGDHVATIQTSPGL